MNKPTILSQIDVAARCTSSWDKMEGDEQVRFCHECKLNVYNLSSMSEADAEALIMKKEGRLCVRFYRRNDGTILTDNCPVGLRRIRNFVRKVSAAVALVITWTISQSHQSVVGKETRCAKETPDFEYLYKNSTPSPGETLSTTGILVSRTDTRGPVGNIEPYRMDLLKTLALAWKETSGPVIHITIWKDGTVKSVKLGKSCGSPELDAAAIEKAQNTKFLPLPSWYKLDYLLFNIDMAHLPIER